MLISRIYIDLDGVLADFDRGVKELGFDNHSSPLARPPDAYEAMWAGIRDCRHFYRDLKPCPRSIEMVEELYRDFGPRCEILTTLPHESKGIVQAKEDKLSWVRKHLSIPIKVNIVKRDQKINFCLRETDLLIDDHISNVNTWILCGGIGIHHISPERTLAAVRACVTG